jgi:hypothetical protein
MRYRLFYMAVLMTMGFVPGYSQTKGNTTSEIDIVDIARRVFSKKDTVGKKKESTVSFLPSLGYNPSIGFQLGVTITGGKYLGPKDSTTMSIFALTGFITTKKIVTIQFRHNLFSKNNRVNLQGNWQISKMVVLDYGAGSGIVTGNKGGFSIGGLPLKNDSATFPIKFTYIRFTERAYKRIADHLYAGAGLSFDIRKKIDDQKLPELGHTPHYDYSVKNGYDTLGYGANGLLFDMQYNSKEHPNRSYRGMYADIGIRLNQKWLGSTRSALQLSTEFRKYWSLSAARPQHVLAFWHWGIYRLAGSIPYLEMPGTGSDMFNRSGRGYTIGAIKGISFFYSEMEYRFPILNNGFMSGVMFSNVSTASNQQESKLFKYWVPAGGVGLRFLFNKNTRTNICLDYAVGRFGSNGWFFGLNEVF